MRSTLTRGLLLALAALSCAPGAAAVIKADSVIGEVTVYPDSALVTRKAAIRLEPGQHEVVFEGVVPEIDENALKTAVSGPAQIRLQGVKVRRDYLEAAPSPRVRELQAQLERIGDDLRASEDIRQALAEEKSFLDSLRFQAGAQLPKDLATKMPAVADVKATLQFLAAELRANAAARQAQVAAQRDLNRRAQALQSELQQISRDSGRKLQRNIVVSLETVKPGALDLHVSYLVGDASWEPLYEARAAFEAGTVELVANGVVRQRTGEDWTDVKMTLSTAKPTVDARMPYVAPWTLSPYEPPRYEARRRASGRAMMAAGAAPAPAAQSMAMADGDFSKEEAAAPEPAPEAPEAAYAQANVGGLSMTFAVPRKVTVKADGAEEKLPVQAQTLPAQFEYSAYPRSGAVAYLGSRVSNSKDLQLLPGRMNVFLDGDYVGASSLDLVAPGQEFDLYLGVDESVKIKRDLLERKADQTLLGGTNRISFKYKLTVENYKPRKAAVNLFEALPVATDDRIKVKNVEMTPAPQTRDWQDRKGVAKWSLSLAPKEKAEVLVQFVVEYPRGLSVEGL